MRQFIFLTFEGFTTTPANKDIENLQVLGNAQGINEKQAFKNLVKENGYLLDTDYNEVVGIELKNKKRSYFSLNSLR